MQSLPPDVQLDILKCLNFEQIFSFKQTNFYFRNLINKYENGLARKKLYQLLLVFVNTYTHRKSDLNKVIEPESGVFELALNDQLKNKWKTAIAKSIPLFLHDYEAGKYNFMVAIYKKDKEKTVYTLELPNIPKNIEEMIIIRHWLEQLFNFYFEYDYFHRIIFNPEMINLLFDNDKTIPLQFNIRKPSLFPSTNLFESAMIFALNHLAVQTTLDISFGNQNISEKNYSILLNILTNYGNKLPQVYFSFGGLPRLYELIIEYVAKTRGDCSRMVPSITLYYYDSEDLLPLSERAEKVEIEEIDCGKLTKYQIANIYNPKMIFYFCHDEGECYGSTVELSKNNGGEWIWQE